MIFNKVYCPACGGQMCLPIAPYFKDGEIKLKVHKCDKCGIEMSSKDYMQRLDKLGKDFGASE